MLYENGPWQMSILRSNSRSLRSRSDSGNRTYISTTSRITSSKELKRREWVGGSALDLRRKLCSYYCPRHSATLA